MTVQRKAVPVPNSSQSSVLMKLISPLGVMATERMLAPGGASGVTLMVKVCSTPTGLTPSGPMVTKASTQCLVAGLVLLPIPLVDIGSVTVTREPLVNSRTTPALIVADAAASALTVTVQLKAVPVPHPSPSSRFVHLLTPLGVMTAALSPPTAGAARFVLSGHGPG